MDAVDADKQRYRTVFADCYPDVVRFAQRRTDPARAEDVAAEVFLIAWRRVRELPHEPGDARAWLYGIARNCLLNDTRGARRRTALAIRLAEHPQGVSDEAAGLVARLDLADAWRRLSPDDQEILGLTVFEQLSSSQAADVLGITPSAYRNRLSRARSALRRHLDAATAPHLQEVLP